jgi:hypothetical protein
MTQAPTVAAGARWLSVIVPCRNERGHIEAFCRAAQGQDVPRGWRVEVLIADGHSDDGTREWLQGFCPGTQGQAVEFILLDNPRRSAAAGLNVCIERARGDVLVRWDVHTTYAPDYWAQCLQALARTGADNVGGPWKAVGHSSTQQAIAAAFQSRWVAGGARSRDLHYEGPADTVYLGCWPRATFERFGGFDEALVRNQDDEHNLRLSKGGARIWQSSRIRSTYVPRARLAQLRQQYLQYGYWKPFVMKKHGQPASLRHLVPGLFVATWSVLALLAVLAGGLQAARGVPGAWSFRVLGAWLGVSAAYALALGCLTLAAGVGSSAAVFVRLPAVIATYHLAYGWGFLRGAWDAWVRGRADADFGRLTR